MSLISQDLYSPSPLPLALLVEDDPVWRSLIARMLSRTCTVRACEDGWAALERLSRGLMPDLVLTDLEMPRLDGLELLEQLKISGAFRHIPVIVLTGHERYDLIQRCYAAGAFDYLVKPFHGGRLTGRVEDALRRQPRPSA